MRKQSKRVLCAACALLSLAACDKTGSGGGSADFAILARSDSAYAQADPSRLLEFPRDHGAHPEFRIEWWYLTANLEDRAGRAYGAQWTLFRLAGRPPGESEPESPWQDPQLYMAHFAVTTPGGHRGFQRYSRGGDHGGIARAGVTASPFAAWLDDWEMRSIGDNWLPLSVRARQDLTALSLRLQASGPLVLQGVNGFSQKHREGGGSHYYSQPFLHATGLIEHGGEVVEVEGQAWLDREWSSQFLQSGQQGWDWFALHLESGEKLMLFQLREPGSGGEDRDYRHGALITASGQTRTLEPTQIRLEVLETKAVAGRQLPLAWRVELPDIGRRMELRALLAEQWMDVDFPYWEGAITASGQGPENRGVGYMELTGYPTD